MLTLYDRIQSLCEQCGLTVTEMCKQSGVTRSILSEYSSGRTQSLSVGTIIKISGFFGVSTDYMNGITDRDNAHCPVCGYRFPLGDEAGADGHKKYHARFVSLRGKYPGILPADRAEKLIGGEEELLGMFSLSVLAHGDGHPDFEGYADWLGKKQGSGYLYEPSEDAPNAEYTAKAASFTAPVSDKIRLIPLYESASAGFGVRADSTVVDYIPLLIGSNAESDDTMCIRVSGNSMYPKIEDGDIVQVQRMPSVDSGKIAVVLLDGEEGLIKRVVYGDDFIELQSINPEYAPRRFEGADVQRIRVVGLVKRIIKDC